MREHKYILNEQGEPVPEPDVLKWGKWFEENRAKRRIAYDEFEGDIKVSTIFLGLDSGWLDEGPPVLWETMIFGGVHDEYQKQYTSKEDALAGHAVAIAYVKDNLRQAGRKFKPEV